MKIKKNDKIEGFKMKLNQFYVVFHVHVLEI